MTKRERYLPRSLQGKEKSWINEIGFVKPQQLDTSLSPKILGLKVEWLE